MCARTENRHEQILFRSVRLPTTANILMDHQVLVSLTLIYLRINKISLKTTLLAFLSVEAHCALFHVNLNLF